MRRIKYQIIFLFLFILIPQLHAEIYQGISPVDNLGDVKNRFPNAKAEKLTPGWAQEADVLYTFTGFGMSGMIVVKFNDFRPTLEKICETNPNTRNTDFYKEFSQKNDEEALTVEWVRWVPDNKIPLQRLISKYGKPENKGFSDEDYQPYRAWPKRGIFAFLTDDEKYVLRIDYSFTLDEYRRAYLRKYKYIPDWLKTRKTSVKEKKWKPLNDPPPAPPAPAVY